MIYVSVYVVPVLCNVTSGTFLPLGVTTVSCNATDEAGNTGYKSFQVFIGE